MVETMWKVWMMIALAEAVRGAPMGGYVSPNVTQEQAVASGPFTSPDLPGYLSQAPIIPDPQPQHQVQVSPQPPVQPQAQVQPTPLFDNLAPNPPIFFRQDSQTVGTCDSLSTDLQIDGMQCFQQLRDGTTAQQAPKTDVLSTVCTLDDDVPLETVQSACRSAGSQFYPAA